MHFRTLASILFLFLTLDAAAQTLRKSRTPWTEMQFRGAEKWVEVDGNWYILEDIEGTKLADLERHCKEEGKRDWQLSLAVEVRKMMRHLDHPLPDSVSLGVRIPETGERRVLFEVPCTRRNWKQALYQLEVGRCRTTRMRTTVNRPEWDFLNTSLFPVKPTEIEPPDTLFSDFVDRQAWIRTGGSDAEKAVLSNWIGRAEALEDLAQLEWLIEHHYAYADHKRTDYQGALDMVAEGIDNQGLSRADFALRIQYLLGLFGDGHCRVSFGQSRLRYEPSKKRLPFAVKWLRGDLVAVRREGKGLLAPGFPILHTINGIPAADYLKATELLLSGAEPVLKRMKAVDRFKRFSYLQTFVGKRQDELYVELSDPSGKQLKGLELKMEEWESSDDDPLAELDYRMLQDSVGYIKITDMSSARAFIRKVKDKLKDYAGARGLVIDVRDNSGGMRDLLSGMFYYFMAPDEAPQILTVAALRVDEAADLTSENGPIAHRMLLPATAEDLDEEEKAAVQAFAKTFQPEMPLDPQKFSELYFTVVHARKRRALWYKKPVVLLMNEKCFSTTEVFLAAFKGRKNVTLIGRRSAGGSGFPDEYALFHSQIVVKLPGMASFRPDGQLYEGKGIAPDIEHFPTLSDLAGETDSMLERARKLILTGQ